MNVTHRWRPWLAAALLSAASPLAAQTQDHQYSVEDIQAGGRLYTAQCALCHGANGDGVTGIDLRRGQFRRSVSDDDLQRIIATGVPGAGMPAFNLPAAEISHVVAYIRAGFDAGGTAVKVGNPARGETVFNGKGSCTTCHRVNGAGSRVAPDLSDIGGARSAAALQRSLLNPSSGMWPINRPVRLVTRSGETVRGRRLNEDTYTVQLIDSNERLRTFAKADLREFDVSTTSTMPAATTTLNGEEIADVIAYLLSLKGMP